MEGLIEAYYAETTAPIVEFAGRYGVDVILVNREAFEQATLKQAWTLPRSRTWEPFVPAVSRKLERPGRFALLELASRCAVVDDGEVAVVPTGCLAGQP
jgi:hypothetical protein